MEMARREQYTCQNTCRPIGTDTDHPHDHVASMPDNNEDLADAFQAFLASRRNVPVPLPAVDLHPTVPLPEAVPRVTIAGTPIVDEAYEAYLASRRTVPVPPPAAPLLPAVPPTSSTIIPRLPISNTASKNISSTKHLSAKRKAQAKKDQRTEVFELSQ